MRTLLLTFVILAVTICTISADDAKYCQSHDDCGDESCCFIGSGYKDARPHCVKRPTEGDECHPNPPTEYNKMFGNNVFAREVSVNVCPCRKGLTCPKNTSNPKCTK